MIDAPDLFGWSQAEAAQERLQTLKAARAVAARKAACAPHGQVQARRETLAALTAEQLATEVALRRLKASS